MKQTNSSKPRVIKDYEKLDADLKEQVKLVYSDGFSDYLIEFKNSKGDTVMALPFETNDKIYLLRMSVKKAMQLIEDDIDFDEDGNLKSSKKEKYRDKHSDVDYLSMNENFEPLDED